MATPLAQPLTGNDTAGLLPCPGPSPPGSSQAWPGQAPLCSPQQQHEEVQQTCRTTSQSTGLAQHSMGATHTPNVCCAPCSSCTSLEAMPGSNKAVAAQQPPLQQPQPQPEGVHQPALAPAGCCNATQHRRSAGQHAAADKTDPEITPVQDTQECVASNSSSLDTWKDSCSRSMSGSPDAGAEQKTSGVNVESLFSAGGYNSNSFTTTYYNSKQGQRVAVIRVGSIITSVFVQEPSGEVWECAASDISFPGGHQDQPTSCSTADSCRADAAGHTMAVPASASGSAGISPPAALSAEAASKLLHSLNGSRTSAGSLAHLQGQDRPCGTYNGARCVSPAQVQCGCYPIAKFARRRSTGGSTSGSNGGSTSGSTAGASCSSRSSAGCSVAPSSSSSSRALPSLPRLLKEFFITWRRRRAAEQRHAAAAYISALDEAAHQALRRAGCNSFVLPRCWPDDASREVQQQRRLRVLLAAYKA